MTLTGISARTSWEPCLCYKIILKVLLRIEKKYIEQNYEEARKEVTIIPLR